MSKNNDVMICINDLYFEDSEDIRKLNEYVIQLEMEKTGYKAFYRKVLQKNELLKRRNEKLHTKCHVYKVELKRCQRKLTRMYKELYNIAFINYAYCKSNVKPKEVIDILKKL